MSAAGVAKPSTDASGHSDAKVDSKVDIPKPEPPKFEPKKTAREPVDVAARTADPLPEIELTDLSLSKAVDLLAAMSNLPITLDADAMALLGVSPRDHVTVHASDTTVGDALKAVAARRGLTVLADAGQVFVTAPAEFRETLRPIRYTVSDLAGDEAVTALAGMVRKLVAPESWQARPGGERSSRTTACW